jgi:hypothetical protein
MDFVITPGAINGWLGVDRQEPELIQLDQLCRDNRCFLGRLLVGPRKGGQLLRTEATEQ